jgi:hypothetical protein
VAKRGERFVDDVTDVAIDGDRATAKVTYHFDKAPDTKTGVEMTFVREDGAWKVCSTGPNKLWKTSEGELRRRHHA